MRTIAAPILLVLALAGCGGPHVRFEGDRPAYIYALEDGKKTLLGKTEYAGNRWIFDYQLAEYSQERALPLFVETREGSWRYEIWPDFDNEIRYPPADWLFAHEKKGLKERLATEAPKPAGQ